MAEKVILNFKNQFNFNFSDQKDRHSGIDAFRRGEKDVLVATDVASKGLDFEKIRHVINFDMPEDIENYGEFNFERFV